MRSTNAPASSTRSKTRSTKAPLPFLCALATPRNMIKEQLIMCDRRRAHRQPCWPPASLRRAPCLGSSCRRSTVIPASKGPRAFFLRSRAAYESKQPELQRNQAWRTNPARRKGLPRYGQLHGRVGEGRLRCRVSALSTVGVALWRTRDRSNEAKPWHQNRRRKGQGIVGDSLVVQDLKQQDSVEATSGLGTAVKRRGSSCEKSLGSWCG